MPEKPPPDSTQSTAIQKTRVEMTQMVLPQFTNALGHVFGGQMMSWIDICAAVAAQRHCRSQVVTASFDDLHFIAPVKQGHILILRGQVNAAFRTSMECGVSVWMEDPLTGIRQKAAKAYATFVALDEHGKLKAVAPLEPESEEEKRRAAQALKRRQDRLQRREESSR